METIIGIIMIFIMFPRASVSARRINEVLDTEPTILDGSLTEGVLGLEGEVTFKHVGFKYPDAADYVQQKTLSPFTCQLAS